MTTSSSPERQAKPTDAVPDVTPEVTHATDTGGVRDNNEDFYSIVPFPNLPRDRRLTKADYARKGLMYVVADGMGGAAAGEVASRMAVRSLVQAYYADSDADVQSSLWRAMRDANVAVYRHSLTSPAMQGMGTTITALVLHDGVAFYGHVGDTRLYRLRDGVLERISKDHTHVQELVDKGVIDLEQARLHPQRNELKRAMGTQPEVDVDVGRLDLRVNDLFLLSSDGLHDELSDDQIRRVLMTDGGRSPQRLIEEAKRANGGPDNITAVVVRVPAASSDVLGPWWRRWVERLLPSVAGVVALSLVGWWFLQRGGAAQPPAPLPTQEVTATVMSSATASVAGISSETPTTPMVTDTPVPKPLPTKRGAPPKATRAADITPQETAPTAINTAPTTIPASEPPANHERPTAVPPTAVPPTAVPPTAVPPTAVPPTAVPPTAVPPTAPPPTDVPMANTAVPPRLNSEYDASHRLTITATGVSPQSVGHVQTDRTGSGSSGIVVEVMQQRIANSRFQLTVKARAVPVPSAPAIWMATHYRKEGLGQRWYEKTCVDNEPTLVPSDDDPTPSPSVTQAPLATDTPTNTVSPTARYTETTPPVATAIASQIPTDIPTATPVPSSAPSATTVLPTATRVAVYLPWVERVPSYKSAIRLAACRNLVVSAYDRTVSISEDGGSKWFLTVLPIDQLITDITVTPELCRVFVAQWGGGVSWWTYNYQSHKLEFGGTSDLSKTSRFPLVLASSEAGVYFGATTANQDIGGVYHAGIPKTGMSLTWERLGPDQDKLDVRSLLLVEPEWLFVGAVSGPKRYSWSQRVWQPIGSGAPPQYVRAMLENVRGGPPTNIKWIAPQNGGLMALSDKDTWEPDTTGIPNTSTIESLIYDRQSDVIVATTADTGAWYQKRSEPWREIDGSPTRGFDAVFHKGKLIISGDAGIVGPVDPNKWLR